MGTLAHSVSGKPLIVPKSTLPSVGNVVSCVGKSDTYFKRMIRVVLKRMEKNVSRRRRSAAVERLLAARQGFPGG